MAEIAIELQHVSKRFEQTENYSVNDVSFQMEKGDFVTVLGSSGSGKTTLLKLINRLYEVSSGNIYYFGAPIGELQINQYRRKIGYVIQQVGLFPHRTVEQNIATVPKLLGWDKKRIDTRVLELLELVRLEPDTYKNRYPKKLSGGEQQRVGLAWALAASPSVLLMDEPFGAIDAITRRELQDEVLRIQQKTGATVLFITHDIQEAFKLGKKVVIMHAGQIQQYATPYEILFSPANQFASQLVSAGDALEKLRVLPVSGMVSPSLDADEGAPLIAENRNLLEALQLCIKENAPRLTVVGSDGRSVGTVQYDKLKQLL